MKISRDRVLFSLFGMFVAKYVQVKFFVIELVYQRIELIPTQLGLR